MFLSSHPSTLGDPAATARKQLQAEMMQMGIMVPDPDGNVPGDTITPGTTPQPTADKPKSSSALWWALGLGAVGVGLVYLAINTPVGALDERK